MNIESKIINGLERLSEVLKSLLWEKAKKHKISPIQIQILMFIKDHHIDICNVSHLAKEFNITKATVSDAVKVLLKKQLLEKDHSPIDNRRYNLLFTPAGESIANDLIDYSLPIEDEIKNLGSQQLIETYNALTELIYQLNQKGIIQVQRTCFNCQLYNGNKKNKHFCNLLNQKLKSQEIRLDCKEHKAMDVD